MHLTPMDIVNREFRKSIRGYSAAEVDRFLEVVSQDYELLYKANYDLKEQVEKSAQSVAKYEKIEATLHNTMILVQQTSEEVRLSAKNQADLILEKARIQAEELLEESRHKVDKMLFEYEELRRHYEACRTQFKTFLLTHIKVAEAQEKAEASITE